MTPLDFAAERPDNLLDPDDEGTIPWQRSDPADAQIMRRGDGGYNVLLPNATGGTHRVELWTNEHGAWVGSCDCDWYTEYRKDESRPCAHLCALRRAIWTARNLSSDPSGRDLRGRPIEPADETRDDLDSGDDRARADGGQLVERPDDLATEPGWTGR